MINIIMIAIAIVVSVMYIGMFYSGRGGDSSYYNSSSRNCDRKHLPDTDYTKPAVIIGKQVIIDMNCENKKKLKKLFKIYQGTELGDKIYEQRKTRILEERVILHRELSDIDKKKKLIEKLKNISIDTLDRKKIEEISLFDLERIVGKL